MSTQRTLSERDWLVNSSCTLPTNTITFHATNKEVFRITADGRLVTGEGLSADEATQEAAKLLIASFEEQIQKMVEKRIAAEREKVRVLREALESIVVSEHLDGCCPYGCDAPTIARAALAATKEDSR